MSGLLCPDVPERRKVSPVGCLLVEEVQNDGNAAAWVPRHEGAENIEDLPTRPQSAVGHHKTAA